MAGKTEKITLQIEATGAAVAQQQLEKTRGSVEKLKAASAQASKELAAREGGFFKGLKASYGEESGLGQTLKMLRGAGAIAGVAMLGQGLAGAAKAAAQLREALNGVYRGPGAKAEAIYSFLENIPLVGGFATAAKEGYMAATGLGQKLKAGERTDAAIASSNEYFLGNQAAGVRESEMFGLTSRNARRQLDLIGMTGQAGAEEAMRAAYQGQRDAIRTEQEMARKDRENKDAAEIRRLAQEAEQLPLNDASNRARILTQQGAIRKAQKQALADIDARASEKETLAAEEAKRKFQDSRKKYIESETLTTKEIGQLMGAAVEANLISQNKMLKATEKRIEREYEAEKDAIERTNKERMKGAIDDEDRQRIAGDTANLLAAAESRRNAARRSLGRERDERIREAGMSWRELEMSGLRRAADMGDRTAEERLGQMELSRQYENDIQAARKLAEDEAAGPIIREMARARAVSLEAERKQRVESFRMGWRPELTGFQSSALLTGRTNAFLEQAAAGDPQKKLAENAEKQVDLLQIIADAVQKTLGVRIGLGT